MRGLDSACGKAPGDRHEGHLLLFFKRKSRLKKGRKKETKCQKDNTPIGENYCGRQSKGRGEYSKRTPPFTITRSYVSLNIGS